MITISNGTILQGTELLPKKANILIEDGKIIEISKNVCEGEVIDATNCIVCPSFLNAHTHIGDSFIKDYGDGKTIEELVKPPNGLKHKALNESDSDEIIIAMEKSMWDMLKSGTTHFIDYREGGIDGIKFLKKAAKNIPINPIILGRHDIFHDKESSSTEIKKIARKLLKSCDGIALSGFDEISDETAKTISSECEKRGKISSIHTGEYEELQLKSLRLTGKTEIQKAVDYNFQLLIHGVYPMYNDLDSIAMNNRLLALCPRSNGTLRLGLPPLNEILKKGIRPLLGTDNLMLNSPNLMREMEYTLKLMRAYYKKYIDPKEILKMGTTNISTFGMESNQKNFNKSNLNSKINKSYINPGNLAQLFVVKNFSKNFYLNIINRVETKDILYIFNGNTFIRLNE
jgi:cytosine/adenosine deaminase-related metal-dependent hydrolase